MVTRQLCRTTGPLPPMPVSVAMRPARPRVAGGANFCRLVRSWAPMALWIAFDSEVAACTASRRSSGSSISVRRGKVTIEMVLPLAAASPPWRVLTGARVTSDLSGSSSLSSR
ncbi:hypothetical protein D3C72_1964930 [compost metagenome]